MSQYSKQKSRAGKRVIRIKVYEREGHYGALSGLRRRNDTKQSQLYSDSWWSIRAGKTCEEGKAVGKSELTTKLLFYPED